MNRNLTDVFSLLAWLPLALGVAGSALAVEAVRPGDEFLNIQRQPDALVVESEAGALDLRREGDLWRAEGVEVTARRSLSGLSLRLSAPSTPVKYVRVRWNGDQPGGWKYLGDAWERGYGDMQWLPVDGKRVMPWYVLASDGETTHGYGVMTQPGALCSWNVDADGITLTADVRCGGAGVRLGRRVLSVCTVVSRHGGSGETPFQAARAFAKQMSPRPKMPEQPVYGFNDWYCDYGKNSAESVRGYAEFVSRLSPNRENRPFMIIDDGWQPRGGGGRGGPWDRGNEKFPSMPGLAKEIRARGARPGIWIHPLWAQDDHPAEWRMDGREEVLDPSLPEVRAYVRACIARLRGWGYDLIKHDFSTSDISRAWGRAAAAPDATWSFHDTSRTTAEIYLDHYRSIMEGAGDALIIGCNTVGHIGAGLFPIQRIGDDTSGGDWARTRKMGVNSLAFRAPQHGAFFSADGDCVGLTSADAIPWALNRQWMDLLARSGTPLFISFKSGSVTPEQEKEIHAALAIAAEPQPLGEPLDWIDELQPRRWRLMGEVVEFDWSSPADSR